MNWCGMLMKSACQHRGLVREQEPSLRDLGVGMYLHLCTAEWVHMFIVLSACTHSCMP